MPTQKKPRMRTIGVKQFQEKLKRNGAHPPVGRAPVKVKCANGESFVVISTNEWEREQETMEVLQDTDLVRQIARSLNARAAKAAKKRTQAGHRARK